MAFLGWKQDRNVILRYQLKKFNQEFDLKAYSVFHEYARICEWIPQWYLDIEGLETYYHPSIFLKFSLFSPLPTNSDCRRKKNDHTQTNIPRPAMKRNGLGSPKKNKRKRVLEGNADSLKVSTSNSRRQWFWNLSSLIRYNMEDYLRRFNNSTVRFSNS